MYIVKFYTKIYNFLAHGLLYSQNVELEAANGWNGNVTWSAFWNYSLFGVYSIYGKFNQTLQNVNHIQR
jgi:hypothetical protein